MAFKKGHVKVGGRKAGTPNQVSVEVRGLFQSILLDEGYLASFKARLYSGTIHPILEKMAWEYGFSKPTQVVEHQGSVVVTDAAEHFTSTVSRLVTRSGTSGDAGVTH